MAQVIEIASGTPVTPNDPNALYVWMGTPSPQFGGLAAFQARQPAISQAPNFAWMDAIESAKESADRSGTPTVYVVRS